MSCELLGSGVAELVTVVVSSMSVVVGLVGVVEVTLSVLLESVEEDIDVSDEEDVVVDVSVFEEVVDAADLEDVVEEAVVVFPPILDELDRTLV